MCNKLRRRALRTYQTRCIEIYVSGQEHYRPKSLYNLYTHRYYLYYYVYGTCSHVGTTRKALVKPLSKIQFQRIDCIGIMYNKYKAIPVYCIQFLDFIFLYVKRLFCTGT